jgi:hypothetical protein
MLNIHELETKWLRYKIKSFIPHVVITFSLIILILIITQFDFTNNDIKYPETIQETPKKELISTFKNKNNTPSIEKEDPKIIAIAPIHQKPTINKSEAKLLIAPSLEFIRNMQEDSPAYYTTYIEPKKNQKKKIIPKKINISKPVIPKIKEFIPVAIVEKSKTKEIKIQRQNIQGDIQHVIKRFKTSNSPALSLFIAKKYYELENYNQSYNYALITNELNNDIEESWIIFAKSLYKLNKKDTAVRMLEKYIATSHSHHAKILLDHIKTGKMK